jgi:uncharacterized protein (DUF1499 family)
MAAAWLAFFDALLAFALIAAGVLAANLHLVTPFMGFQMFAFGFLLSILGVIVGLVAIFLTRRPDRAAARNRAVAGTVLCLVIALPLIVLTLRSSKYPPINDITTDVDNPPEFVNAVKLPENQNRNLKYDKAKYAAAQQNGYGVIAPMKEKMDPAAAFQRVSEVANQIPTWKVTYTEPSSNTLEAVATSKSFHFQDDIVIQVRPSPDGASLIEMRSKSRDGIGDLGVNRRRIARFFDRMALALLKLRQ